MLDGRKSFSLAPSRLPMISRALPGEPLWKRPEMKPALSSTSVSDAAGKSALFQVPVALHPSKRHADEQPSPLMRLPSSQVSPVSLMPLPQTGVVQSALQPSPFRRLPSSHCSPACTAPSPQYDGRTRVMLPDGTKLTVPHEVATPASDGPAMSVTAVATRAPP